MLLRGAGKSTQSALRIDRIAVMDAASMVTSLGKRTDHEACGLHYSEDVVVNKAAP